MPDKGDGGMVSGKSHSVIGIPLGARLLGASSALALAAFMLAGTVGKATAQDGKLPPILILPGEAPQTIEAPAPQQPAATPPASPAPAGSEPAVVISPPPGGAPPASAPPASAPPPAPAQPPQTAEPAATEDEEPAVVISPPPGGPPPAPPSQPPQEAAAPPEDDEPAVVISPPPGGPPPAPPSQPEGAQEEATPPQAVLPDEEPLPPGGETSSEDPAGEVAADQGEDMAPIGSTTQVLYAADGVDVPIDSQEALEELAEQLKQTPGARVQLYAYATSPDGSENAARRLSLERAQAVRGFLVDRGVAVSRFTIRPQGIATDGGPADRVDVVLIGS